MELSSGVLKRLSQVITRIGRLSGERQHWPSRITPAKKSKTGPGISVAIVDLPNVSR
jgi:hypothetical protein